MTVKEIKEMIKNMSNETEVIFAEERFDRDGYPYEVETEIVAIVPKGTKKVNVGYGIMRYEREGIKD